METTLNTLDDSTFLLCDTLQRETATVVTSELTASTHTSFTCLLNQEAEEKNTFDLIFPPLNISRLFLFDPRANKQFYMMVHPIYIFEDP